MSQDGDGLLLVVKICWLVDEWSSANENMNLYDKVNMSIKPQESDRGLITWTLGSPNYEQTGNSNPLLRPVKHK